MSNFKEDLTKVKAFAFDVDGVFSGNILLDATGGQIRSMNMKDGYAVQHAIKKGYPIAIITGGNSESVKMRFEGLGVTDIYLASSYKLDDFKDFYMKYDINPDNILYMGDDIPDYEVLQHTGLPTCPANAVEEVKAVSKYISLYDGGEGCVRDVIEQVLRVQDNWMCDKAFVW